MVSWSGFRCADAGAGRSVETRMQVRAALDDATAVVPYVWSARLCACARRAPSPSGYQRRRSELGSFIVLHSSGPDPVRESSTKNDLFHFDPEDSFADPVSGHVVKYHSSIPQCEPLEALGHTH